MERDSPSVPAWAETGGRRHVLDAHHASRYSVWARFRDGDTFKDSTEFSRLVLNVNGEEMDVGPCRLIAEPNIDGFAGRLVALGDFYDFESLLFRSQLDNLHSPFVNLPLLLGHKRHIKTQFRDYLADLTYDLSVYRNVFDALDEAIEAEPGSVAQMVETGVYQTEGRTFMGFLNRKLDHLKTIVADYSEEEHNRHGFYLRRQLWHMLMCAPIIRRTNLKPRGYAGDSEMMRMIYENEHSGDSLFSRILHKHALERKGAEAVRNRRRLIAEGLRSYRQRMVGDGPVRVLSVACGPARELADIVLASEDAQSYQFTMFDQDQYALMEAAKLVNKLEADLDTALSVKYVRESVRTMLGTRQLATEWGQYDFVYSMGLFDYLTPPVARAVLRKLYGLLSPRGEILVGNFHLRNPSRIYMEYWLDWKIFHRDRESMKALARRVAPDVDPVIICDDTEIQMLLRLGRAV